MPWRLIQLIIICALLLFFVAFNLGNKCDINFWFNSVSLKDVPVFFTAFAAFVFGMLCTLPYIIILRIKNKKNDALQNPGKKQKKSGNKISLASQKNEEMIYSDKDTYGVD